MRLHDFARTGVVGIFILGAAACSGAATQPPGAAPAGTLGSAGRPPVVIGMARPSGRARTFATAPTCSGAGTYSFVGGQDKNVAAGGAAGVLSGFNNHACDFASGVGAGLNNFVSSSGDGSAESFIAGGSNNIITGFGGLSFIGAGYENAISGSLGVINGGGYNVLTGQDSVIAGGTNNSVPAELGTVSGGHANQAQGEYGVVPGGEGNIAAGYGSLAAGIQSWAANPGAFVWSDDAFGAAQLKSTANNQFLARASGGVKFFSNASLTTGVTLAAGSGTWASLSDRAVKTNIEPISDNAILDKVSTLPISEWSYIDEHGVRHVGPMAQDFYAAFGVGEDNKHITSIDEDGVALAAIKALHRENTELRDLMKSRLSAVNARLSDKDRALHALQREVAALSAKVAAR